jgi:hypothetical protein
MRRIDELPGIQKEFPDKKMVISRAPGADIEEPLSANEQTVWNLLDTERSLYYLISHARMPSFDTHEALKHLIEKQMIKTYLELAQPEAETAIETQSKRKSSKKTTKKKMPVAVLMVLFAVSTAIGAKSVVTNFKPQAPVAVGAYQESSLERNRIEAKIRLILECHQAMKGSYPASLDDLEKTGLTTSSFLQRVEQFSFRYHLTPLDNTYTLL